MGNRRIPRYLRDADGREVPPAQPSGRIPADLSKQAPNNSYAGVPLFYDDMPFVCADCGREEIWTAKQQQWWYEVAKGSIYSRATRCRACRQARRKGGSRAIQPIGSVGMLMKLVRAEIEPAIVAAGFVFEARNKPRQPGERAWIDYKRGGELFGFAFEKAFERPARLVAELLDDSGGCRTVASTEFNVLENRAEIMATIKAFASAVTEFMATVGPTSP